jgi:hypothetical protein
MCKCRAPQVLLFAMTLLSACSPSVESSDVVSSLPNKDSLALAEYNYDRQMRYNDSVSAQRYADSLQLAQPAKPIPTEEEHKAAVKKIFYFHDDFEAYPCQVANADTMIQGIVLSNVESTISVLGEEWSLIEDNADMPHQNYSNAHGSQFLTCFFHYGDGRNQFSEFQVSRNCAEVKIKALPDEFFVSANGIQLGMSKDSVTSRIGSCYITDTFDGNLVLKYVAEDHDNSKFLQRWNYPKYYAWYEFKEDKLIRFRFGFEYP